ncbi:MAG: hypothetical protein ED557_03075 [Balneola sp.]|nr:MAG: hypothetical protein ED557_03075 [Balneola sp.]
MKTVFLDTGPLVALFSRRDQFHHWASTELNFDQLRLVTCEPVLTELFFLTRNSDKVIYAISGLIKDGLLFVESGLSLSPVDFFKQIRKYQDIGTSFADISLVQLYNQNNNSEILTTDSDFLVYRDSKGKPLRLISPYLG